MRSVSSSSGLHLQFVDEELYLDYTRMEEALHLEMYRIIRDKHGIWATNQNKFVASVDELNEWDSKHMEDLYASFYEGSK